MLALGVMLDRVREMQSFIHLDPAHTGDTSDRPRRARRGPSAYFHSHSWDWVFPSASTSCSKITATLFSRDHSGDELW